MNARRLAIGYSAGLSLAGAASWVRVAMAGTLRIDTGTPAFFVASALLGLGLAIATLYAVLLVRRADEIPIDTTLRWALLANLAVVLAAPLTSSDLFHYLLTGRLQVLGRNPFASALAEAGPDPLIDLVAQRYIHDSTSYGPLTTLALGAAAWIGELAGAPFWGNAASFKLMMAACELAFLVLAARHLRAHPLAGEERRAMLVAGFCPLLAWEIVGEAHNDGLLLVALMLFVTAATEGRTLVAALALAAAVCAKITVAPVLALYLVFLFRAERARALWAASAAAGLGVLLMAPYLPGLHGLGPTLRAIQGAPRSHSIGDFLHNVLAPIGPAVQEQAVRASFILCLGACAVAFGHAARARTVPQMLRGALLFLLAWDMTIPTFQPWYVSWLLPFAVAEQDPRWRRLVGIYAFGSVLTWAAPIDPFSTMALNGYVIWQMAKLGRASR